MNCLTTITTLTPTRMGMGQAVGLIDLPVHRDASTNWPILSGSGVKGVLKDGRKKDLEPSLPPGTDLDRELASIFGTADGGGTLVVTDLMPILFPVRSSYGVFAWVTCPLALERANDLARLAGQTIPAPLAAPTFPDAGNPTALIERGSPIAAGNVVALEELDLTATPAELGPLATQLAALTGMDRARLEERMCVVHDDIFTFLTETGTETRTKTALEYKVKKAKDKFLRQEEYLPSYAVFLGFGMIPTDMPMPSTLQIGAEASTGAGLVRWRVTR